MEINTKLNAGGVNKVAPSRQRAEAANKTPASADAFASSTALEVALNNISAVRPEAVDRARGLINDPSYPSDDTIKQLAGFLAAKMQSNS